MSRTQKDQMQMSNTRTYLTDAVVQDTMVLPFPQAIFLVVQCMSASLVGQTGGEAQDAIHYSMSKQPPARQCNLVHTRLGRGVGKGLTSEQTHIGLCVSCI